MSVDTNHIGVVKMEMDDFIEAKKIVDKLRDLEEEHGSVQDIIAGHITGLVISTKSGEMKITDEKRISNIICRIEEIYFDEEEELELKLKNI